MATAQIEEIKDVFAKSKVAVVFTGAGMSTSAGLPDFRSAKGLWKGRPESLASIEAMKHQPDEFYFFYQWRISKLWEVAPSNGHKILADLEKKGCVKKIITQNVDGLHQQAGSKEVIELHGTLRTVKCTKCKTLYDSRNIVPHNLTWEQDYAKGKYRAGNECICPKCRGPLRPNVVLFGEPLPETSLDNAFRWSQKADFFMVLGSSLQVAPANLCPQLGATNGAKLLIVNNETTPFDNVADWVINTNIDEFLQEIYL